LVAATNTFETDLSTLAEFAWAVLLGL
jgi:hypothetical protein